MASAEDFVKDGVVNATRSGQEYTDAATEYVGSVSDPELNYLIMFAPILPTFSRLNLWRWVL
jgi:hypothetical protein